MSDVVLLVTVLRTSASYVPKNKERLTPRRTASTEITGVDQVALDDTAGVTVGFLGLPQSQIVLALLDGGYPVWIEPEHHDSSGTLVSVRLPEL